MSSNELEKSLDNTAVVKVLAGGYDFLWQGE